MGPIKILVVSGEKRWWKKIRNILKSQEDLFVVEESEVGQDVAMRCAQEQMSVCLLDENQQGMDWTLLLAAITTKSPATMVIVLLDKLEKLKMKQAISGGAREILEKVSVGRTLEETIRRLHSRESLLREGYVQSQGAVQSNPLAEVVVIFSPKGGVGKTTLSANLATGLALMGKKVLLIDLNLQFGDASMALDVRHQTTLSELIPVLDSIEDLEPEEAFAKHQSGLYVLSAPIKPEQSELLEPWHIGRVVEGLQSKFDFMILDCPNYLNDIVFSCFDAANRILLLSTLDITTIKNVKNTLLLLHQLQYEKAKIKLILNKVNEHLGIKIKEFEETVGMKTWAQIPYDVSFTVQSLNRGIPCVMASKKHKVSRALYEIVNKLMESYPPPIRRGEKRGFRGVLARFDFRKLNPFHFRRETHSCRS